MKSIKLLAWDGHKKKIRGVRAIKEDGHLLLEGLKGWKRTQEYEIMMYSGLKDCNGAEIHDGCILKVSAHHIDDDTEIQDCVGVVKYEDGAFWLEYESKSEVLFRFDSEKIEIIGNEFENPELLDAFWEKQK